MTEPTSKLNTAIAAVMARVHRIAKGDENKFANYRYTSIDDFKDAMRPLLAENGLTLLFTEEDATHFELQKPKGGTELVMRFVFMFQIHHVSGEFGPPERSTVMLPYTGAQTSGAARSYAIKEWMKSKFLASCGKEDADSLKTDQYGADRGYDRDTGELTGNPNKSGRKPAANAHSEKDEEARGNAVYWKEIEKDLDKIKTESDLDDWYAMKRDELNARLPRSYVPTLKDRLHDMREDFALAALQSQGAIPQ